MIIVAQPGSEGGVEVVALVLATQTTQNARAMSIVTSASEVWGGLRWQEADQQPVTQRRCVRCASELSLERRRLQSGAGRLLLVNKLAQVPSHDSKK
jgi:hypothetical protein